MLPDLTTSLLPPPNLVSATGGTVTSANGFTIHSFDTGATYTPTIGGTVETLVVAGGGKGGNGNTGDCLGGGGGGGGGYLYDSLFPVTPQAYSVTVGGTGANSVFSTMTSLAGGAGGQGSTTTGNGSNGGSGGGAMGSNKTVGTGSQGSNGGLGYGTYGGTCVAGGGGGGASNVGNAASAVGTAGTGGSGLFNAITGTTTEYGQGGAGGISTGGATGAAGTANTGNGGNAGGGPSGPGGNGGSGKVVIRYPTALTTSLGNSVGTQSVQGKLGLGKYFDGSSDQISLADNPAFDFGTGDFTFSFWVNHTALTSSNTYLEMGRYTNGMLIRQDSTTSLCVWMQYTGVGDNACFGFAPVTGTWYHLAITRASGTLSLYVNGALFGTATMNQNIQTVGPLVIGHSNHASSTQYLNGTMDELRIDNVARSGEQIRQAFEFEKRMYTITTNFAAHTDGSTVDTDSTSFYIEAAAGAEDSLGRMLTGDKVILRENVDGTVYTASATVNTVSQLGGLTIEPWDQGSTFPPSGFSASANVFRWQREYFDLTGSLSTHRNTASIITFKPNPGSEGATFWIDGLMKADYLNTPTGSTLTSSTGQSRLQYRLISTSSDSDVSAAVTSATADFQSLAPTAPTIGTPTPSSDTSISWAFTDNSNDETGFRVYNSFGAFSNACASANISSCTETGLTPNTSYTRKVTAYNGYGNSLYSDTASTYTLAAIPAAPVVSNRQATTVQVNPQPAANPASTLLAIFSDIDGTCDGAGDGVYIAANGSFAGTQPIWQTDAAWGNITVTGLESELQYLFCVKAKNANNVQTGFSPLGSDSQGYIPLSGNYIFDGSNTATGSFVNRYIDGNNPSRYVIAVDNAVSNTTAPNTAGFEVRRGILTISDTDTLAVGSLDLTGGSLSVLQGGKIEIGKPVWALDPDNDGISTDQKLYVGTQPAGGKRKNLITTLTGSADCNGSSAEVTYPHSQCYTDADGDGYTSGLAANTTCLNSASCDTATKASASSDGAAVTTYTAGRLRNASNGPDCNDGSFSAGNTCYMAATGGTITTDGNYKVHTFTSSGTFTVTQLGTSNSVQYLIIAGGGGGGYSTSARSGGGGGAGGLLTSSYTVSQTAYGVTVGTGGQQGTWTNDCDGENGTNSVVFGQTAYGGGGAGGCDNRPGLAGASGGGAAGNNSVCQQGGAASYGSQGSAGGAVCNLGVHRTGAGGGGHAGGVANGSGTGGSGTASSISGSSVTYAVGGAAGVWNSGCESCYSVGAQGTDGRGNGGQGGNSSYTTAQPGGRGGNGVVILRYQYQ